MAESALRAFVRRYQIQSAYQVAQVFAYRGEPDSALVWLERAYAQRDQGLSRVKVDPLLTGLRRDSRYDAFLRKMQLPL